MGTQMTTCVLPHRDPAEATHGLICGPCSNHLANTLTELANQLPALALIHGTTTTTRDGIPAHRADPPAPCRLDLIAITDPRTGMGTDGDIIGILGVLHSWARIVREDQHLTPPSGRATVMGELGCLTRHHGWIITQPWVDDYAAEIRACQRQLHHALGIAGPTCVGRCPIDTDDGPCAGRLVQDRWGGMGVQCTRCGARWGDTELRRLGAMLT